MAYYLGKDVNVYWTTEQFYGSVSGTATETTTGSSLVAWKDGAGVLVRSRSNGIADTTQLSDVTGIDFTPGATNEDISYMGKNTNLSAQVKHEFSISITKKKNDTTWDKLFNDRGRDGVYTTSGGTIYPDYRIQASVEPSGTGVVHDGLTTSRIQNFGYRVYLVLKDSTEIFVLRNSCITGHTVSLNADGTQEETLELYSYVNPVLTNATSTGAVTGLTAMADI